MTNLLARILLAIMLWPLAAMVYLVAVFAMIGGGPGDTVAFTVATLVTSVFVLAYWLWLWRASVRWTHARVQRTVLSGIACVVAGVLCAVVLNSVSRIHEVSFCIFIAGVVSIVTWLSVTVLIWRETTEERVERLRHAASDVLCCPRCGYNMTGLHEARCPECGVQYTLNQLYSAQHRPEIGDAAPAEDHGSEPPRTPRRVTWPGSSAGL